MALSRLIYCSRASCEAEDELPQILKECELNNPERAVTGALLYDRGYFLQLIEGERRVISKLFTTIAADDRHTDVEIISVCEVPVRLFAAWSMHSIVPLGGQAAPLYRYMPGAVFEPSSLGATSVDALMLEVSESVGAGLL